MSVLDFPTSPTNGQYYNGFVWNAANETWDSAFAPRPATIPISGPNYIINGAFDINQRVFTSTTSNGLYGFDRWRYSYVGGTATYSAQSFTPGTAPVNAVEGRNFARLVTTGQSATGDFAGLNQRIEDVRTLEGQTVTFSFWARAASGTPKVGVALEQVFGTGGSAAVVVSAGSVTVSTSWARYSVTVTLPDITGKTVSATDSSLYTWLFTSAGSGLSSYTNIGVQNTTVDFWGVQVEQGAAPTEFRRNSPSIAAELLACQRYYYSTLVSNPWYLGLAFIDVEDSSWSSMTYPTIMRATPTVVMSVEGVANRVRSFGGLPVRTVTGYIATPYGLNFLYHEGGYTVGRPHAGQLTANAEL
jgi:hypothetical protein